MIKNRLIIFTLVLSLFFLSGCGGSGSNSSVIAPLISDTANTVTSKELVDKINVDAVRASIPNNSWEAADNEVSDFFKYNENPSNGEYLGLALGPEEASNSNRSFAPATSDLPSFFSWRNYRGADYTTPVKNQGGYPTCVAFAVMGALEMAFRIKTQQTLDLSELFLFHFGTGNYNAGWNYDPALDKLKSIGTVSEEVCPYRLARSAMDISQYQNSVKYNITDYTNVFAINDNIMKAALLKAPVMGSMTVYQDFLYYKSGIYSPVDTFIVSGKEVKNMARGGHAILIVGYNDAGGYYECKNSWGIRWGEKGFFKIKYGAKGFSGYGSYVLTIEDYSNVTVNPPTNLTYSKRSGNLTELSWTASNADKYCVYVNNLLHITTTDTRYTVYTEEDTYYYVVITGFKGPKASVPSDKLTIYFPGNNKPPNSLSYSVVNGSSALIKWESTGAEKYNIYVNGQPAGTSLTTQYQMPIKENAEYLVTISSVKNSKESARSEILRVYVEVKPAVVVKPVINIKPAVVPVKPVVTTPSEVKTPGFFSIQRIGKSDVRIYCPQNFDGGFIVYVNGQKSSNITGVYHTISNLKSGLKYSIAVSYFKSSVSAGDGKTKSVVEGSKTRSIEFNLDQLDWNSTFESTSDKASFGVGYPDNNFVFFNYWTDAFKSADSYNVYLNNKFYGSTKDKYFSLGSLTPNVNYFVNVKSVKNKVETLIPYSTCFMVVK